MKKGTRIGFTLIELLIVVAIIAILAAIAVPNFLEAQTRSKVARAVADMRTMATAIESYMVDNNHLPPFLAYGRDPTTANPPPNVGPSVFINGEDGISARQFYFTTPVAYITSLLPEAFKVISSEVYVYDTYDFAAAAMWWPGDPVLGDVYHGLPCIWPSNRGPDWPGSGATSGATWMLSSAGPDLDPSHGGGLLVDGAVGGNLTGCDYDATNGTLSVGDIIRVGSGPASGDLLPYYDRIGGRIGPPTP